MKTIELTDPKGRKTLMYSIESDNISGINNTRLERVRVKEARLGDKTRRRFHISDKEEKDIIVLSLIDKQVFVNIAIVSNGVFRLASVSTKLEYIETKADKVIELYYTPTCARKIFVIDLETGNEVEPEINMTASGEMKGLINLSIGKKYLTIELRNKPQKTMLIGACQILLDNEVLSLNINKEEAKKINIDKYKEIINSGKSVEKRLVDQSMEKEI